MEVTIGGDRLGSGKKMKASFNNYSRSTHDLSYIWRSTMASGTLVPFMSELALPGDTFDIGLGCSVLTHPTIGPLFGSYKVQLDVFQVPIRLYQSGLHMNLLNIGMKMNELKLPQVTIGGRNKLVSGISADNQQINPSCIFSYLNIRGLGFEDGETIYSVARDFNAIPYLAYWDIYKNYYANKQEEIGAMIHSPASAPPWTLDSAFIRDSMIGDLEINIGDTWTTYQSFVSTPFTKLEINGTTDPPTPLIVENLMLNYKDANTATWQVPIVSLFNNYFIDNTNNRITFQDPLYDFEEASRWLWYGIWWNTKNIVPVDGKPYIETFQLDRIDDMRKLILQSPYNIPYTIDESWGAPYGLPLESLNMGSNVQYSATKTQEGLALKTYQSDLFNNWLSTEWIDGVDGISAITAVDTSEGSFTIDELQMSKKIYDMLNRIALSGGTYDDWLDAVYTHERTRSQENPAYVGGLIKELTFQEVISNARSSDEPLGTLAGRGVLTNKHKGGKVIVKVDEPSYIIGIVSLTPRVDYSQGNKWDTNLKTMDDLHKPALDQIGFQDLITDQMAWFDTKLSENGIIFKSAGKQPAWINYMTNVNVVRGNFADADSQMFMTLNRRYDYDQVGNLGRIKDLTTYIDPAKFNHIFADTRLDSQNFWTQISLDITARRKMSAKLIPNL